MALKLQDRTVLQGTRVNSQHVCSLQIPVTPAPGDPAPLASADAALLHKPTQMHTHIT